MTSTVLYLGDLRTECVHLRSGQKTITDAPTDNHGRGEAFSPTDLTATSLGTCLITVMGIAARNHHINIDGARVEVTKHMASDPRRIAGVDLRVVMPAGHYGPRERKLLEKAGLTCPVALSLHPDLVQNIEFIWPE